MSTVKSAVKYDIEKFDGVTSFSIRRVQKNILMKVTPLLLILQIWRLLLKMRIRLSLLVVSLPHSYKHFKEVISYETLSFEDIKFNLILKCFLIKLKAWFF